MHNNQHILLVEDDMIDVMIVKRALSDLKFNHHLKVASNGEEALEHLKTHKDNLPWIILLDINMPKMNGLEFLAIIKNDNDFKRLPVVMLTTSKDEKDTDQCFNLGASGYMIKPVGYGNFLKMMEAIGKYWELSQLPN
jgi:CheY-like chemotaxis protein